jgi:hypothetical protein
LPARKQKNSFHDHANPTDINDHLRAARNCHGIQLDILQKLTCRNPSDLQAAAKQFPQAMILYADKDEESDAYNYTRSWKFEYINVTLPDWIIRVSEPSHLQALHAKEAEETIGDTKFEYSRLHHPRFTILPKANEITGLRRELNAPKRAKLSSGSHCSLYDA